MCVTLFGRHSAPAPGLCGCWCPAVVRRPVQCLVSLPPETVAADQAGFQLLNLSVCSVRTAELNCSLAVFTAAHVCSSGLCLFVHLPVPAQPAGMCRPCLCLSLELHVRACGACVCVCSCLILGCGSCVRSMPCDLLHAQLHSPRTGSRMCRCECGLHAWWNRGLGLDATHSRLQGAVPLTLT